MMRPTDADDILFKLTLAMDFQEVYKDTELSLTKLANLLGVDSSVLNEIIKSNYGYGFRKYLNEIRITKLMDKIQKGVLGPNVYKCMEMSGYRSRVTFFNAFKSKTGVSLTAYYKMQSQLSNSIPIIFDKVADKLK